MIIHLRGSNYVHFNLMEMNMYSTLYSSIPELRAHVTRAHRLRAEATGRVFGDLYRRFTGLFQTGWISAAAR